MNDSQFMRLYTKPTLSQFEEVEGKIAQSFLQDATNQMNGNQEEDDYQRQCQYHYVTIVIPVADIGSHTTPKTGSLLFTQLDPVFQKKIVLYNVIHTITTYRDRLEGEQLLVLAYYRQRQGNGWGETHIIPHTTHMFYSSERSPSDMVKDYLDLAVRDRKLRQQATEKAQAKANRPAKPPQQPVNIVPPPNQAPAPLVIATDANKQAHIDLLCEIISDTTPTYLQDSMRRVISLLVDGEPLMHPTVMQEECITLLTDLEMVMVKKGVYKLTQSYRYLSGT